MAVDEALSSSSTDSTVKLLHYDFSSSNDLRTFASSLYHKIPHMQQSILSFEEEQALRNDQAERAQLECHMRLRYAANTRKLTEPRLSKQQQDEIARRSKAYEKGDFDDLRKHSRHAYLEKRKKKKLLELEDEIRDHEYIFEGVKLTEAEEREMRYKKKLCELAKKPLEEDYDDEIRYKMPDAYDVDGVISQKKRFSVVINQEERFSVAKKRRRYRDPQAAEKMNRYKRPTYKK